MLLPVSPGVSDLFLFPDMFLPSAPPLKISQFRGWQLKLDSFSRMYIFGLDPCQKQLSWSPQEFKPPSLPRGVRCQDCLDDFLESGCPHLCLISTTIGPSTPELMRRHLQPGLEDPTDKDAIQQLHKCFPPDPLGINLPSLQNTSDKNTPKLWFSYPEKSPLCSDLDKKASWKIKTRHETERKSKHLPTARN